MVLAQRLLTAKAAGFRGDVQEHVTTHHTQYLKLLPWMPASEFWLKTKPKSGLKPRLWRGSYIKSFSNLYPVFYLYFCYYQTFPTFSSRGKRWTGSVQPSVGTTRWQSANSKMSETPRWMIKYLKWYKRDIKINCREKFHTKGCYFLRTNSTIFDCDSLLKEMVQLFFEELGIRKSMKSVERMLGCCMARKMDRLMHPVSIFEREISP